MREVIIFLAVLLIKCNLQAQTETNFVLSHFDSLKTSEIRKIHQTNQGSIWIGTKGKGVYRFLDGKLEKIIAQEGRVLSGFISIVEDDENAIWFGGRGLMKYNNDGFTFIEEGPESTVVFSINKDEVGNLYFAGNRGYDIYTRDKLWERADEPLNDKIVHDIIAVDKNNVWVATRKTGLIHLNEDSKIEYYLQEKNCRKLLELRDGSLLIGTNEGIFQMNPNKEIEGLIIGKVLMPEFEDEEGNIWFSSESEGIFRYDGVDWFYVAEELKSHVVFSIIETGNEELWVGTNEGIERLEKSTLTWTKVIAD